MTQYRLMYLDTALEDMSDIKAYLDLNSETAWSKLVIYMKKQMDNLKKFPYMGERYKKYRRLVCGDYLVFFKVNDDKKTVEVYHVLHCSRNIKKYL